MNRSTWLLVLCLAQVGCMPMVQHGPWVRDGTSGGMLVGAARISDNRDASTPGMTIAIDGSLRVGHVPQDSTKTAFAGGIQTSLWALLLSTSGSFEQLWQIVGADVYASYPRGTDRATAAGASISYNHLMPYIQFGSKSPSHGGWYSTQAFLLVPRDETWMWLPSITKVEAEGKPRAAHLTLGGAVGQRRNESFYMINIAVYVEYFGSAARVR